MIFEKVMDCLVCSYGSRIWIKHEGFVSFDIVVVMVEKHVLLNNLFYKLAYMAYFGLFRLILSLYAHVTIQKHRENVFDLLL